MQTMQPHALISFSCLIKYISLLKWFSGGAQHTRFAIFPSCSWFPNMEYVLIRKKKTATFQTCRGKYLFWSSRGAGGGRSVQGWRSWRKTPRAGRRTKLGVAETLLTVVIEQYKFFVVPGPHRLKCKLVKTDWAMDGYVPNWNSPFFYSLELGFARKFQVMLTVHVV